MSQLTGNQVGTSLADVFAGTADISLSTNALGAGILNALVSLLDGDDSIESIVSVQSTALGGIAEAFGALFTAIDMGNGNDALAFEVISDADEATAYGIAHSSLTGGQGDNTFVLSAISNQNGNGYGAFQSTLLGGDGKDNILIDTEVVRDDLFPETKFGVALSTVDGGNGDDTIFIGGSVDQSKVAGGEGSDVVKISTFAITSINKTPVVSGNGLTKSVVDGGEGNDEIAIDGAVSQAAVNGGSGEDQILITHSGLAVNAISPTVFQSTIDGGEDDDAIEVYSDFSEAISEASVFGGSGNDFIFLEGIIAVSKGTVDGGEGNDDINILGQLRTPFAGGIGEPSIGLEQAAVFGGQGDDAIAISATSITGTGIGLSMASAYGGEGNDTFTVTGTNLADNSGIGVRESALYGEGGDDTFAITGTTVELQDALIYGGSGNDTFDTGIGNGKVDGGAGDQDRVLLDFFDAATMTIVELANNGLLITGTQDNQGNLVDWSQEIVNMEQFQISSDIFASAADAIAALTA